LFAVPADFKTVDGPSRSSIEQNSRKTLGPARLRKVRLPLGPHSPKGVSARWKFHEGGFGFSGPLSPLKMNLGMFRNSRARDRDALGLETEKMADRCIAETRTSHLLHPPLLDEMVSLRHQNNQSPTAIL
jgi:hypothetical protein